MEFKPLGHFSTYKKNAHQVILGEEDIKRMLANEYLLEQRSHYIVTKEKTYDDSKIFQHGTIDERVVLIDLAFAKGQTIVIKDLENWNTKIRNLGRELGKGCNVHLYLTPSHGTSFDWHTDDRDVFIIMQAGNKTFEVEQPNNEIMKVHLSAGDELYIPYGVKHRAFSSENISVHLSFGYWRDEITIDENYKTIQCPLSFKL